jgi:hypothetical protein
MPIVKPARFKADHRRRPPAAVPAEPGPDNFDVSAVVNILGHVDRQGDLLLAESPSNEFAQVSEWNHSSMTGDPPVGVAKLVQRGNELWAYVKFDSTPRGRAACEMVRAELPDWSVGYDVEQSRDASTEEGAKGAVRVVTEWRVWEVSPVDKAACQGAATRVACCGRCAISAKSDCRCTVAPPVDYGRAFHRPYRPSKDCAELAGLKRDYHDASGRIERGLIQHRINELEQCRADMERKLEEMTWQR